jgi:glucose-1-phosphate thymidylyltransferase
MTDWFGIVPAAGIGARMQPYRAAKELIQIGYRTVDGRPHPQAAVEHVLHAMREGGADRIMLVLSPEKWEVFRYLGSGQQLGVDLAYLCQEDPLGLPHALDLAAPFLSGQTVCMGMPDTIVRPHDCYARLLEFHEAQRADLSLGVFPADQPQALAPVVIEPGTYHVLAIVDKPETPPASNTWGIAAWSPAFTELLHDFVGTALRGSRRELLLSDAFVSAVAANLRVRALTFESGEFHDIGTPAGLLRARRWLESESAPLAAGG